ncbi:urease accessory protein UreE [Candidatus Thiosymbion oneisti]|uniref:urease accessory protein UreE n=1 Tax=Candidatus Thiosymbion oneisti TaxID=589554 RepID=UPI000A987E84|nr:urease accessory protein UreE [Candidatus Thiosymbion oneisti]
MIRLIKKLDRPVRTDFSVTLTLEQRVRSRLRVRLDDGREAGIFLARGDRLRDGDCLISEERLIVRVKAAREPVSTVLGRDPWLFARACYHLGNRHVALQIEPGRLRYPHDHVLDALVRGLGLEVILEEAPIEPERGAYGGPGHTHGAGHREH